jgi:hypothetical protein
MFGRSLTKFPVCQSQPNLAVHKGFLVKKNLIAKLKQVQLSRSHDTTTGGEFEGGDYIYEIVKSVFFSGVFIVLTFEYIEYP